STFSVPVCSSFFFSSRRRHTRSKRDWSSDVCSSDLTLAGQGYFEKLIREYLLDNPHCAVVTLYPEPGLASRREEAVTKKLADYKIGRASCRERGEISVVAGCVTAKERGGHCVRRRRE